MSWDFTVDSDIQLDMAKYLYDKADELDTQFANLYTQIGPSNLGTHWVGSDYDAFNVGCEGYKQALSDMTDSIRMYANHFEMVAEGTDYLSTACIDIVTNMTTRGDALPSGATAVTPNITNPTGGTTQYGGGTSTVYGPPTVGTNRFNGGSNGTTGGVQQGTGNSTVYGPPTGGTGYGTGGYQQGGTSTVYGPPTNNRFNNGGTTSGSGQVVSTVYGPPTTGTTSQSNISTVYGPAPTQGTGYSSHSNISTVYGPAPSQGTGYSSHSNISTVYGPAPSTQTYTVSPGEPVTESYTAPVCVYAPPQVEIHEATAPEVHYETSEPVVCVYAPPQYMPGTEGGGISTKYGAPCTDGTIGYGTSSPISTVYGAPTRDTGVITYPDSGTTTPISTVYGAPTRGTGSGSTAPISTVYGAPVRDDIKIVEL